MVWGRALSVYVDKSALPYRGMIMCHMIADTPAELRAMAVRIGVDPKWFQANASMPHFDICKTKKALALAAGAVELERREFVAAMKRIRQTWPQKNGKWLLPVVGSFKNYCTCGGYAWQMNGRPEAQPHMEWCPQRQEYAEWWAAKQRS